MMNNFELHDLATELSDKYTSYHLARKLILAAHLLSENENKIVHTVTTKDMLKLLLNEAL